MFVPRTPRPLLTVAPSLYRLLERESDLTSRSRGTIMTPRQVIAYLRAMAASYHDHPEEVPHDVD